MTNKINAVEEENPEMEKIPENRKRGEVGKMINKISNRLKRRSLTVQKSVGVSGSQGNILNFIMMESEVRPVYQKDVEEEFGLRPSTASEVLKLLEGQKLIRRETEESDGRYKKLVFTERSASIGQALRQEIEGSETLLLRGISEEDRETFLRIAEKMLKNLDSGSRR